MTKSTKPTSGCQARMPFIVLSNMDRVDQTTRKLIRSHVMRGKNQKRTQTKRRIASDLDERCPTRRTQDALQDVTNLCTSPKPDLGARVYFVDFPDDIEPQLILDIEQVAALAIPILFPLLAEIGLRAEKSPWLHPAARDSASLYITAFATRTFIDRVLRHQPMSQVNPAATLHLQKGLKLLRERLLGANDEVKVSDDTIGAVLDLATAALFLGDTKTARQHIQGLGKMTDLRGGLQPFHRTPGLLMEILRCDLSIALLTYSVPVFCCRMGESMPEYPREVVSSFSNSTPSAEQTDFLSSLHPDLAEVWLVMRKFCLLVNLGVQTGRHLQPATIYGTMTSVMYRLLDMSFAAGSRDETVRHGLVVFAKHVFLQGQKTMLPCDEFSQEWKTHLADFTEVWQGHLTGCEFGNAAKIIPPQVMLWLIMVGAISLCTVSEEAWLRVSLRRNVERTCVRSWKEMQAVLKASMWIEVLDDRMGKQIYNSL